MPKKKSKSWINAPQVLYGYNNRIKSTPSLMQWNKNHISPPRKSIPAAPKAKDSTSNKEGLYPIGYNPPLFEDDHLYDDQDHPLESRPRQRLNRHRRRLEIAKSRFDCARSEALNALALRMSGYPVDQNTITCRTCNKANISVACNSCFKRHRWCTRCFQKYGWDHIGHNLRGFADGVPSKSIPELGFSGHKVKLWSTYGMLIQCICNTDNSL